MCSVLCFAERFNAIMPNQYFAYNVIGLINEDHIFGVMILFEIN
jgi:hypothetical protein